MQAASSGINNPLAREIVSMNAKHGSSSRTLAFSNSPRVRWDSSGYSQQSSHVDRYGPVGDFVQVS